MSAHASLDHGVLGNTFIDLNTITRFMSFFDEPKNAGLALMIVAAINLIGGIIAVVDGSILAGVGSIIAAVIYLLFGNKVRTGEISGKMPVLASFVKAVGIAYLVTAVCGLNIVGIIVAVIILFCAYKIGDGQTTTADKIIWILLLIAFILGILGGILSLLAFPIGTITGICAIILYVFMLKLLLDNEVKKQMGM